MRIAITGATGLIGRHLVGELSATGHQLTLFGRDRKKLERTFGGQPSLRLIQTDYMQGLNAAFQGVEAVVHLAGLRYWEDMVMMDYITSNVVTTDNLFSSAMNNGISNIVFASSRTVYNPEFNFLPFSEEQDCFPSTHYGVSKLSCEKIASYYNHTFGMRISSLRIGQVVAHGERDGFMLSTMIRQARSKQTLNVWGKGSGARDYLYIKDVVGAIRHVLEHPEAAGVFNISCGKPVTHLQLAEEINRAFGNAGNLSLNPDKQEDASQIFMSCAKAERVLGWRARWSLADMLADLAQELGNGERGTGSAE